MLNYFFLIFLFFTACSTPSDIPSSTGGAVIFISNLTFTPMDITAAAGETIVFVNEDETPHHILSESAPSAFDDTQEFDSQVFASGTVVAITVPSDAVSGEVFYFYDDILKGSMATPDGTITVE